MIAIARKNLSVSFFSPNSFLCKSNVHYFLPVHFFSTSRVYDVLLHKHQFSPELASLAASRLPKFRCPKRADSMLSFLRENSFTTNQLEKIVKYDPQILGVSVEGIKLKLKVFQDLGLSPQEIAKMMSSNQAILHLSTSNNIIPSLSTLKGLLGSNQDAATLLNKSSWFVTSDLERSLMPNVEILKSCGIPMDRILHFLYIQPRCFVVKPDIMRKSVDKAIQFGVSQTSTKFIYAASVFCRVSEGIWEVKLQTLRELGFSDDDIFTMLRKSPLFLSISTKKMKNVTELLLATGKYNISSIVTCPTSLGRSIEKRLVLRLQILRLLESRNLIKKWPCLSTLSAFTDAKFVDRFVWPYYDEIGNEYITKIYVGNRGQ